jgi:hypothetical protein
MSLLETGESVLAVAEALNISREEVAIIQAVKLQKAETV